MTGPTHIAGIPIGDLGVILAVLAFAGALAIVALASLDLWWLAGDIDDIDLPCIRGGEWCRTHDSRWRLATPHCNAVTQACHDQEHTHV